MKLKASILLASVALLLVSGMASAAYTPVPGDLIKVETSPTVYLVDDAGQRIALSASAYEVRYNNNFSLVKTVTEAEMGTRNTNLLLNRETSVPNGTLIIYETDQPGIFLVENGYKRVFSTWQGFTAMGYDFNDVTWVGRYTMYPTGTPIQ